MKNFIKCAIANGASVVESQVLFNISIAPRAHRPWTVGCLLEIPENPVVLDQRIDDERGSHALCIVVTVQFPDGDRRIDRLFLGSLTRSMVLPDKTVAESHGTAVNFVRSFLNWASALDALRGKSILVTSEEVHEVEADHSPQPRIIHTYGFDLA